MSRVLDNLIAYRVLSMLVKPFDQTDAFKFGIIDKNGKKLRDPNTEEEKDSFDYLSRLTFNLKKLLNKLPGGDTKLKNIVAALYLIKEQWKLNTEIDVISEEELQKIVNMNIILAEETLQVKTFNEEGEGAPTNVSMPADNSPSKVSTDVPAFRKKKPPIVKRPSVKL